MSGRGSPEWLKASEWGKEGGSNSERQGRVLLFMQE